MVDITIARKLADDTFKQLDQIAQDIVNKQSIILDDAIKKLDKIDVLSNDDIRKLMITSSVEAYKLSNFKEQSELKDACAMAIYKEGIATAYNTLSGTVESRKNQSIGNNIDKQMVSILFTNVASRFKTKVDEAHRLANVLSNVLISRQAEAKLYYNPRSENVTSVTFNNESEVF